jgi:UDP-GlcNAc:undecaprenyl-phosphate/decaprenyl-phosphate GlcNAc-1-phosphate transferase
MLEISLAIFSLFIIYLIDKNKNRIVKKIKIIDKPDKIRKLHKKPTPLLGGMMIFSSFFLINLYLFFLHNLSKTSFIILICCAACLILGLIDDIKKISYKFKFSILIVIFFLFVSLDSNLQINKIYFATFNKEFYFNYFSIPFTILCLSLFINSMNLIDGINGLCILISIILLAWLIKSFQNSEALYILIIISFIYILYFNLKENIFLGNSGSLFIGCLIGLSVILNYNIEISKINYPVENIFIAFMLPGLDMLRVFAERIFKKKNPFLADRSHLHYLLLDKGLNLTKVLTILCMMVLSPIIINQYEYFSQIKIILIYVFLYSIFIIYLKKFTN